MVRQIDDRYTLERELGRGGMATVWCARDLRHDRNVAIKIIHPELAGAIGVDRFVREVRLTARLQHPNIVPILDSGSFRAEDGTSLPWYAMPYVEGESLRTRLDREHQLPIDEAIRITEAVGDALQSAHQQGIVHRDIKPENVLLSDGHVYVVDFGVAKALIDTGAEALTSTGLSIGTPAYMSPEQATADRIDARTDQYSLATILYEMLTGEPPFGGVNPQATIARRIAEPARPLRSVRSTVTPTVERAILKALERSPADRFPDVRAFLSALHAAGAPETPVDRRQIFRRVLQTVALIVVIVGAWLIAKRMRTAGLRSTDPQVLALYRRGVNGYDRRTQTGIDEAISAFRAAIQRDSSYVPAWTGLAKSYARAYGRGFVIDGLPRDSLVGRGLFAADRALELDSMSSDVWVTRAMIGRIVDPTEFGPSLRNARRGVELDSMNAVAWQQLAITLADIGKVDSAAAAWKRCAALAPRYTECLAFLSLAHYWKRQFDTAALWGDSAVSVDPNYLLGRQALANVEVERGNFTRAEAGFEAARRVSSGVEAVNSMSGSALAAARAGRSREARAIVRRADSLAQANHPLPLHMAVYLAQAHTAVGNTERAIKLLEAYEPSRDLHFQLHLRCDPPFDPLRGDTRFKSLLIVASPPRGKGC